IPGDAPALADISVGSAYYGGMNSSANLVTNPDFETNTAGWATANVANVHQAATSLTRITTDSYTGTASGQVVVPGTNSYEGVDFLISGTFSAGVPYRFRMRIHA